MESIEFLPKLIQEEIQLFNKKNSPAYQITGYRNGAGEFGLNFRPAGLKYDCPVTGYPRSWCYDVLYNYKKTDSKIPIFTMNLEPDNEVDRHAISLKIKNPQFTREGMVQCIPELDKVETQVVSTYVKNLMQANWGFIPAIINQYIYRFRELDVQLLNVIPIDTAKPLEHKDFFIRMSIIGIQPDIKFSNRSRFINME